MEFLSSIFHPIVELMTTLVTYAFQLTQMVGYPSYGVAIILLTIVIKAVLAPLTVKQIKSMKAMQELQPRMQELQNKYGVDPKRLSAAGRGEYNPITDNDSELGKQRNRRTQIIVTPRLDQFLELIDKAPEAEGEAATE